MPTAEQVANALRSIIPIGMGLAAFILGLTRGDMGIMALGAGLIGAPSVLHAVGSSTSSTPAPAPAPAATSATH